MNKYKSYKSLSKSFDKKTRPSKTDSRTTATTMTSLLKIFRKKKTRPASVQTNCHLMRQLSKARWEFRSLSLSLAIFSCLKSLFKGERRQITKITHRNSRNKQILFGDQQEKCPKHVAMRYNLKSFFFGKKK